MITGNKLTKMEINLKHCPMGNFLREPIIRLTN